MLLKDNGYPQLRAGCLSLFNHTLRYARRHAASESAGFSFGLQARSEVRILYRHSGTTRSNDFPDSHRPADGSWYLIPHFGAYSGHVALPAGGCGIARHGHARWMNPSRPCSWMLTKLERHVRILACVISSAKSLAG